MKINIANIGTKEWLDFKADITFGLYWGFKEIGFDVSISLNEFRQDVLNILVGSDFLAETDSNTLALLGAKVEYIVYEVEAFDGTTINGRNNFNLGNYLAILNQAKIILTPYAFNMRSLSNFFPDEKIAYVKWGYHEGLDLLSSVRRTSTEFDAIFFGLPKGARAESLAKIKDSGNLKVKILGREDPISFRNYFISRSRWGLQLTYGESEKFVNPFRLYILAASGVPIITDKLSDDDGYLALCRGCRNLNELIEVLTLSKHSDNQETVNPEELPKLGDNLKHIFC